MDYHNFFVSGKASLFISTYRGMNVGDGTSRLWDTSVNSHSIQ